MPAGSLRKYFDVPNDAGGNSLSWPGTMDGYPVRGQQPTMTQAEYEQIPLVYDAKGLILKLPADMDKYLEIIDRAANGWYQLRHEKFLGWDQENQVQHIFLQWLEIYGEPKNAKSPFDNTP